MPATLQQIAKSVRRVRFSEAGYEGKDQKAVWHQGSDGCELVTRVDKDGKVVDQEFSLRGEVVVWHRERPIRTGRLRAEALADGDRGTNPRAGLWDLDPAPSAAFLDAAVTLAEMVPGDDRYIKHLAAVLRAALAGLIADAGEVTTGVMAAAPAPPSPAARPSGFKHVLKRIFGK